MEYLSKPWTIITGFRDGGMASHGAAIGLLIGLWLFSRKNKLPYVWSLDRIMIAVGIGGAVVRLGNLFNSEIFGMATTLPWGFEFVRSAKWVNEFAPAAVHPTQIYEALCYLATFGLLCWLYYAKDMARRRPGILFGIGLIGIFLTRFFIEFIKTEQEAFERGWLLDMGQWLSIPFILLGIYMIYRGATQPEVVPVVPKSPGCNCQKEEKMSNYPMVNEINRLVGDLLAGGGEVFLPGVGSLYTERRGARRISRRSVVPPSRAVSFTSQERGVSLVAEISGAVQCDAAEAQDVYDRWLARTLENGVLTIEGVGVLKLKHFTPDAAFDRRLNPQGREPVRIKPARKFDWALWIGIAAILVALGFGGYEFLKLYDEGPEEIAQTTGIPGPEATAGAATADSPAAIPAAADSGATTGSAASAPGADAAKAAGTTADTASGTNAETRSEPAASGANAGTAASSVGGQGNAPAGQKDIAPAKRPETRSAGTADAPASLVSGRRYVVLGVFSTPENAARAVDAAAEKDPSVRCGIYRFGTKFMVSPFESADMEACALFVRNYSDRFPGLWTYTAR